MDVVFCVTSGSGHRTAEEEEHHLTKVANHILQVIDEPLHRAIQRPRLVKGIETVPDWITRLLTALSRLEFPVEDLLASIKQFPLRQPHQLIQLLPFRVGFVPIIPDSALTEQVRGAQRLVHHEDQDDKDPECHCPLLVLVGIVVGRPHHASPILQHLHDAFLLKQEEGEFDLSLDTSWSGILWVWYATMNVAVNSVQRLFVKNETSLEDGHGDMHFDRPPQEVNL